MKKVYFIIILFNLGFDSPAQIPNNSFENWTNGIPDNWFTVNLANTVNPVTRTSASHTGMYAAKGEVVSAMNNPVLPVLLSGTNGDGFNIEIRPDSFSCYYQFYPQEGDRLLFAVEVSKNYTPIGFGSTEISEVVSSYSKVSVPINYVSSEIPDRCIVTVIAGSTTSSHVGTFFLIDDAEFISNTVSLNEDLILSTFKLEQNYPNPFNPQTTFRYSLPFQTKVIIKVFDITGNEVETLVNTEKPAGDYEVIWQAVNLPGGVYFCRMQTESFTDTKKLILMK